MLRRLIGVSALAAALSVAMVMLAAPALAKGPSQAHITGPGLTHAITVSGNGEPGQPGALGTLAMETGLFMVLFGTSATTPAISPDLLRAPPPNASLGPRYTIIYTVPGITPQPGEQFGRIRQDIYPDAAGGPVIYTQPGQAGFGRPLQATGWLRAASPLTRTLARLGVPRRAEPTPQTHLPRAVSPPAARQAGSRNLAWWLIATAVVIAAATVAGTTVRLRHRPASGLCHRCAACRADHPSRQRRSPAVGVNNP